MRAKQFCVLKRAESRAKDLASKIHLSPQVMSVLNQWFCCFIFHCCSYCLWGFSVCSLFCYTVVSVLSSFAIILLRTKT